MGKSAKMTTTMPTMKKPGRKNSDHKIVINSTATPFETDSRDHYYANVGAALGSALIETNESHPEEEIPIETLARSRKGPEGNRNESG